MKFYSALFILFVTILFSCSKEEEAAVFKAPITILQPSTDPANIVKGLSIKYDIRFVNDEYIDSVMVFYQIDSMAIGYQEADPILNPLNYPKDSMVRKVVYGSNDRKNEKSLDGNFMPHTFPQIGKKIYLIVRMHSKTKKLYKRVPLIVS
ncbi:MAG: hypothetical protein JNL75_12490 [Chitinophagales bacterium]|nr:hypothetical protein [Chitinophagales bacterium]